MRGHEEPEKENKERWLLTYADLITLLLAFFIIMFSMSNLDLEKYKAMIASLGSVFGGAIHGTGGGGGGFGTGEGEPNWPHFSPGSSFPPSFPPSLGVSTSPRPTPLVSSPPGSGGLGNAIEVEAQRMEEVRYAVEGLLAKEHLDNDVTVTVRQRGLVISINSSVLFASGSAELTPKSKSLVTKIASVLTPLKNNQICVEGHTDTDPIHTAEFPSNWRLSVVRADNVRNLLLITNKNLDPSKISIIGYGEYRPLVPNNTAANKAKNRRVNIVILKDEYNKSIDIVDPLEK